MIKSTHKTYKQKQSSKEMSGFKTQKYFVRGNCFFFVVAQKGYSVAH